MNLTSLVDRLAYRLLAAASQILAVMPERLALGIGAFFGRCFFYFSRRRRNAYADLKAVFGSSLQAWGRWKILKDHYAHLGKLGIEVLRFPSLNRETVEKMTHVNGIEKFYETIRENRGAVLLTAHFGNWELLQIVAGILGHPLHVLARDQKHKKLNEMLNRLRESHGSVAVRKGMEVREIYRALKSKKLIGLLNDRDDGKLGGVILPFLGRKTTVPTGAFEMARRTGAPVLPCFIVRQPSGRHEIFVFDPIRCGEGTYQTGDLIPFIQKYVEILESMIRAHPEQWLWAGKRWKYSWTKKILILSDGKKGHYKQSEAIAKRMALIATQYGRSGMEYEIETAEVRFRSGFARRLFPWAAFLFMPWIQGRLGLLRLFFEEETLQAIQNRYSDFIVSAGSSLVPLNLCLAKENHGKSIVVMKPPFPFNLLRYDLAVVPMHDQGKMPKETIRTLVTPQFVEDGTAELAAEVIKKDLRHSVPVRFAVFLGGNTRGFRLELAGIEKMISTLERMSKNDGKYVITTSRRTPEPISHFLKSKSSQLKGCELLVIATEDSRPEVVQGMMNLAEILIVTEDSISMISEALRLGKKVVVLTFPKNGLPDKHRRFQQSLASRSLVTLASPDSLEENLRSLKGGERIKEFLKEEESMLQERLEAIL